MVQYQDFHSSMKRSVQNDCRGTTLFDSFYCIYLNIRCDFINLSSEGGGALELCTKLNMFYVDIFLKIL